MEAADNYIWVGPGGGGTPMVMFMGVNRDGRERNSSSCCMTRFCSSCTRVWRSNSAACRSSALRISSALGKSLGVGRADGIVAWAFIDGSAIVAAAGFLRRGFLARGTVVETIWPGVAPLSVGLGAADDSSGTDSPFMALVLFGDGTGDVSDASRRCASPSSPGCSSSRARFLLAPPGASPLTITAAAPFDPATGSATTPATDDDDDDDDSSGKPAPALSLAAISSGRGWSIS